MLIPTFGIILFIFLYVLATLLYPGGSQADKNSLGFSWVNNYWCNLLNEYAINGKINPARPIALFAMVILSLSLIDFFVLFPKSLLISKTKKSIIQWLGSLSMCLALFIFTSFHDIVINVSVFFGVICLIEIFSALWEIKWKRLFWLGTFNIPLIILNNILYYGGTLINYLPLLQKFTFLFFLCWICMIDLHLFSKEKSAIHGCK